MAKADDKKSYNILLVGKTGNGKTLTAASLLGVNLNIDDHFRNNMKRPTLKTTYVGNIEIDDIRLNVIDTPGFCNSRSKDEVDDARESIGYIVKANEMFKNKTKKGITTFVLTLQYGARYTKEESAIFKMLKNILSREVTKPLKDLHRTENSSSIWNLLANWVANCANWVLDVFKPSAVPKIDLSDPDDFFFNNVIVVFTNGDDFRLGNDGEYFKDWLRRQKGDMEELLKTCNYGAVLFENLRCDKNTCDNQRQEFIKILPDFSKEVKEIKQTSIDNVIQQAEYARSKSEIQKDLYHVQNLFWEAEKETCSVKREELRKKANEYQRKLNDRCNPEDLKEIQKEKLEMNKVVSNLPRQDDDDDEMMIMM